MVGNPFSHFLLPSIYCSRRKKEPFIVGCGECYVGLFRTTEDLVGEAIMSTSLILRRVPHGKHHIVRLWEYQKLSVVTPNCGGPHILLLVMEIWLSDNKDDQE